MTATAAAPNILFVTSAYSDGIDIRRMMCCSHSKDARFLARSLEAEHPLTPPGGNATLFMMPNSRGTAPSLIGPQMPQLSIVTTLYRSEPFVAEFYRRVSDVAGKLDFSYEIIFVNDGSPDKSADVAKGIAANDNRVRVIDLSRNFGHHVAAYAAIEAAAGELVFLLDSDLEEHPEWLVDFHARLQEENADVVYGVQGQAAGKTVSRWFYRVFNLISETEIPPHACTIRLMRRSYVNALLSMRDRKLFMAGMFMWVGFKQLGVQVSKSKRPAGRSSYTILRQFGLFVDAATSFSSRPLYMAFFLGTAFAAVAAAAGLYLVGRKLLLPDTVVPGFTSVIVAMTFIAGLNLLFLGVIGIYVAKIFAEVKQRPLYVVRPDETA